MTVQDLFDLRNRVAIVTGGGRGLGLAITEALAEAGATVVIASRRMNTVNEAAHELAARGLRVEGVVLDVTQEEDIKTVVDATFDRHGRIDILVNNSGVTWGEPFLDMPVQAFKTVMDVNVSGTFLMTQYVARIMHRAGYGKVINLASIAGIAGTDSAVLDAHGYSVSKGAVVAMTRDLARKLAPFGISVNAIAPGFFPTKMSKGVIEHHGDALLEHIPLKRFGTMDDIKGIALLLSSSASNYMTGSVVVVDGGTTA